MIHHGGLPNSIVDSVDDEHVVERCPKCGCPTHVWLYDPLTKRTDFIVPCKCDRDKQERDRIRNERSIRSSNADKARDECFPFKAFKRMNFANDDRRIESVSNTCRSYAEDLEGARDENSGLMLYGPTGSGKTFYAACIANEAISQGFKVKFARAVDIANDMDANFKKDRSRIIHEMTGYDFVVIDDFGFEAGSRWQLEHLASLIDALTMEEVTLIITTNLSKKAMESETDRSLAPMYSRIFGCTQAVELTAKDRRRKLTSGKAEFYKGVAERAKGDGKTE